MKQISATKFDILCGGQVNESRPVEKIITTVLVDAAGEIVAEKIDKGGLVICTVNPFYQLKG